MSEEGKFDNPESKAAGSGENGIPTFEGRKSQLISPVDKGLDFGADFLDFQPDAEEEDEEMKMAILESLRL